MSSPVKLAGVIQRLRTSFADVKLEDGIGLREGQAIDDRENSATRSRYRSADEQNDWQNIPVEELKRGYSSLAFFDPKGMRFHLPTFLIAELEGTMRFGIEFHVTQLDEYALGKLILLSLEQKAAVEACLRYMLEDERFLFAHASIARSSENYWGIE